MGILYRFLTGHRTAWVALALAIAAAGIVFSVLPAPSSDGYPDAGLPASTQSAQVEELRKNFPSADTTAAVVVFARDDADLTEADTAAIGARSEELAQISTTPQAVRPQFADDGAAAMVAVPLKATDDAEASATDVRKIASTTLPAGLKAYVTGPVGFQADIANSFAGADTRLLLVTVLVVALLLIVTYRSPVLWIVPLIVVAFGDGLARQLAGAIGSAAGVPIDASISGIQSVLVFGAGTNYALLLVARYREELTRTLDNHEAMATALARSYPPILASGGTVALSLLTLEFASLGSNRTLGWACAIGIASAMAAALLVLPPALVVCGRRVFWPFAPVYDPDAVPKPGLWSRLGTRVSARPWRFIVVPALGLGVLALGLFGVRIGLAQTDQFVGTPPSVQAQQIIDDSFGAGATSQTLVLTPDDAVAATTQIVQDTANVTTVTPMGSAKGYTELGVAIKADPASDQAFTAIESMRSNLADNPATADALVGGQDAQALDELRAAEADQRLIMPLVLAIVFLVLIALLQALIAPVLLVISVVVSFGAALGAGTFLFTHVLGYPALDTSVLLFSFLFLVALGVDYNIFLTTRAREERRLHGTRAGMIGALGATGAVITSAGILLAAVFAVLGVLPVVALMQVGVIVCIGVLLDTLVVRTLVVPAMAFVTGERFWWPARAVQAKQTEPQPASSNAEN